MKTNYVQKAVEAYRSEFGAQKIDPEWLSTYYTEVLPADERSRMPYAVFRLLVDKRIGNTRTGDQAPQVKNLPHGKFVKYFN